MEFYGKINLLKSGLVFSDLLTTVIAHYRSVMFQGEIPFRTKGEDTDFYRSLK